MSSTPPRLSKIHLLPLYFIIFIGFVGYSIMITVFTPMIIDAEISFISKTSAMGQRTILLGTLLSLYPLGQFLGSPILGAFSDRYGRKKILMFSLTFACVFYFCIALSLMFSFFWILTFSLFFAGITEANIVVAQGSIADCTEEKDRPRLFGYIFLSASSAYVVGPIIAGKLAKYLGFASPFWGVLALLILLGIWTKIYFRETHLKPKEEIHAFKAFTNMTNIFIDRRVRSIYGINFLIYLSIFGFFRCYPMYLVDEFDMGVSKLSEFIAWVSTPVILSNLWLTGFITRFFSSKSIATLSAFGTGASMAIVILFPKQGSLWITLFITGLFLAVCLPTCSAYLSSQVEKDEQGRVMGNNQSLQVGAEAVSAIFGGLIAAISVKLPLIVLGIFAIVASILFRSKKTSAEPRL